MGLGLEMFKYSVGVSVFIRDLGSGDKSAYFAPEFVIFFEYGPHTKGTLNMGWPIFKVGPLLNGLTHSKIRPTHFKMGFN